MELLLENSVNEYRALNEATTEASIETFTSLVGKLIEEKYKSSLAYQIAEVQPLKSAAGKMYALQNNAGKLEIVSILVELLTKDATTGLSQESLQDIKAIFGKDGVELAAKLLKGFSDGEENNQLIAKLEAFATVGTAVTLSASENSEQNVFEILQRAAELVVEMNDDTVKGFTPYLVLPKTYAASFLALGFQVSIENNDDALYIGKYGKFKVFVNPDTTETTTAFVGLKNNEMGKSSVVFSPYQYTLVNSTKYDNGETNLFIKSRFAITENPLSANGVKMLRKFDIASV